MCTGMYAAYNRAVFRVLTPLLLVGVISCTATTAPPRAIEFAPLSPAESDEALRRIESISADVPVETYEADVFRASGGVTVPYRLLRPSADAARGPHPLVVIFHGSGAIGTDNRSQVGALARSWATGEVRRRFPAFVLIPQFAARSANYTTGPDSLPYSEGTELLAAAVELVHHIRAAENVSRENTYAVGFSMGGSAIWNVLRLEPGLFARAVIVGGVPTRDAPGTAGATRVLLVHGDKDTENPFAAAWNVFVRSKGGIELWRFRGLGHDFPPALIATDRIREWLFASHNTEAPR